MNHATEVRDAAPRAEPRRVTRADLATSLALGWRDMRRAPLFALFFAGVYVAGGLLLVWALTASGQVWWTIPISLGFPLLGPFVAVGFYEISRRLDRGEALDWAGVLGVILRQKDRQIPSIAAIVVVFFLFWNFLAHMIFALFMGLQVMTNISTSYEAFLTPNGVTMLVVGTVVGAVFSALLYSMTVVALPMLLDREVDFVTAILTSIAVVRENPGVMLGWGVLIAVLLFMAMLPAFLGLFVVLPLLGHASWHLYTRALT